jgi:hypothetical protein
MFYADINPQGLVAQWEDTSQWNYGDLPEGFQHIEITEDQYSAMSATSDPWYYVEGEFTQTEPVYVPPPPTAEQILQFNMSQQAEKLAAAGASMAPILVGLQLGDTTVEIEAKAWQSYYVALKAVDLTVLPAAWPAQPA